MDDSSPDVYPIHVLDNIKANHCYVDWLMRFNDVLDAEKLKTALSRLLEIGDWKKLGGRLQRKVICSKHALCDYEKTSNNRNMYRRMEISKSTSRGPLQLDNKMYSSRTTLSM